VWVKDQPDVIDDLATTMLLGVEMETEHDLLLQPPQPQSFEWNQTGMAPSRLQQAA
jgi:hypothetical protein